MRSQRAASNAKVYWRNVPPAVWAYTIGGYQVLKKWLSYRTYSNRIAVVKERPSPGSGR